MRLNEKTTVCEQSHFGAEGGRTYAERMSLQKCCRSYWLSSFNIIVNYGLENPLLAVI
jgi:hypothetical protein